MTESDPPRLPPFSADVVYPAKPSSLAKQLKRLRARKDSDGNTNTPVPMPTAKRAQRRKAASALPPADELRARIEALFARNGWQAFAFQTALWQHGRAGRSGLLHATTGAGKTWAAWGAALLASATQARTASGLRVLWITPMRALAQDTVRALSASAQALGIDWEVGLRTGDTSAQERAQQRTRQPATLVTTPESLSVMLSHPDAYERLVGIAAVIVDEWHELLGSKRGVQVQLALARLRRWNPNVITWGLSATLGNLDHACEVLAGPDAHLVQDEIRKALVVDTLIPDEMERFPWAGHLGLKLLDKVIAELETSGTTLLFTNTRSQAELWYQALLAARPDWAGLIALHHGSLDAQVREWVELGLKEGRLRAVVCTSSLDLGVDFLPVERVLQLGSPKGVARLLQRAGRSGHAPGRPSRVTCVPAQALELLEAAAARRAVHARQIEARCSPSAPLDVLVQHIVTLALGGGFTADDALAEIRDTWAYRLLSNDDWQWALNFVVHGGQALGAYPEYRRVTVDESGVHRVTAQTIARHHRLSIGTIVSDSAMTVKFVAGERIGSVEESFIARLNPGDCFMFGGRLLELVRVRDMTAYVRATRANRPAVPRWMGGRMPLSSELADSVVALLDEFHAGRCVEPEMQRLAPLLRVQEKWSLLPRPNHLLIEMRRSREGHHAFFFPFAGRQVHGGLAALFAWRVAQTRALTFSISFNDYGIELLSAEAVDWQAEIARGLLATDALREHISNSLNAGQLARRKFREIARVAGLIFQGYPGQIKYARQLQASSGLLYDVFERYDPDNRLLRQARDESLTQEFEFARLEHTLRDLQKRRVAIVTPEHFTPLSFPLMVERWRERLSSEKLSDRLSRMIASLEKAAADTQ